MKKEYVEICDFFFREAEYGNWQQLTIKDISKKLKKSEKDIKKVIPNKNYPCCKSPKSFGHLGILNSRRFLTIFASG